ncbi:MAG: hypothetical protein IIA33_03265 [Planctomycetes bacterium]|nr:hypothetical protein [Planctomycetota bacterium]
MSVFDVRHQPTAQRILQLALQSARVPHAYVFHGPEGVGREMLAVRFAKLLLCGNRRHRTDPPEEYASLHDPWLDSCGHCKSCTLVDANTHPDCHFIHRRLAKFHSDTAVRARKAFDLGIDVIRQFVIEAAGKKPVLGVAKVFVIRECERLTLGAQNALLKTLEEPPDATHLILLTNALGKLLPTTRSRCQAVSFRPLPPDFVAEMLHALRGEANEEQIHYLANHQPGSLGSAIQLCDYGFYGRNQELVESIVTLGRTDSLKLARHLETAGKEMSSVIRERSNKTARNENPATANRKARPATAAEQDDGEGLSEADAMRQALRHLLAMMATLYRDLLRLSCGCRTGICNTAALAALEPLAARLGTEPARQAIRAVAEAESQLNMNANTRLCLEGLAIRLARVQSN